MNGATAAARRRQLRLICVDWRRVTDAEAIDALVETHAGDRGMRRDELNNCMGLFRALRDWSHATENGQGFTSYFLLGQRLYGADEVPDRPAAMRKSSSIYRWAKRLERAGLVRVEPAEDMTSTGATIGLRWRMLDPRRSSSAGQAPAHGRSFRRRRESARQALEHRHRPRGRRCGRASLGPFVPFFDRRDLGTGCSSSVEDERGDARVCARGAGSHRGTAWSDAHQRHLAPHRAAALERAAYISAFREWRDRLRGRDATPGEAFEALVAAGRAGEDPAVLGAVYFSMRSGRSAKAGRPVREAIRRHAAQADRCANMGAGQLGAGAELLLGFIDDCFERVEDGLVALPRGATSPEHIRSLSWFVVALRREARRWARHQRHRQAAAGSQSSPRGSAA